jgi:Short C-terminal domain
MFGKRKQAFLSSIGLDPALLAYQQRMQQIMSSGSEMPATLRSFELGEVQPQIGGRMVRLELTIEPSTASHYDASFDQVLPETVWPTLAAGQRLTVKVSSEDPQCAMLWNTPHAAGGADPETGRPLEAAPAAQAAEESRIERLTKLQELRSSGVLTEQEFQAQKAKLLDS